MTGPNRIVFIALAAVLCSTSAAQQDKPAATPPNASANQGSEDLVVARVSGEPITEKQVLSAIDQLSRQKQMAPDQLQQRDTVLFTEAVNNLVMVAVLKNQARQEHVAVDKARVDEQLKQISQRFPSQDEFQKEMTKQGVTETQLRQNIEESLSMQQVIDNAVKNVPGATDVEIKKFYDENPDKFAVPERVHAAHILLAVDQKSAPEQKAEIRKKLEVIRADIESRKITFADAAAKFSQDPSNAQKAGDLGFFARNTMVKPFEDVAFATQPGTLSPIVETQFGCHIIQVIEVKPAGKALLEEAKSAIKQYLDQSSKQSAAQKYLDELKGKAKIETFMTQDEWNKRRGGK